MKLLCMLCDVLYNFRWRGLCHNCFQQHYHNVEGWVNSQKHKKFMREEEVLL